MSRLRGLILAAVIGLSVLSCAKEAESPLGDVNIESFLAWMEKNAPEAVELDYGVFMDFKQRAANWEQLPTPKVDTSWIRLSYTGYTLAGDVFETRDSLLAAQLGTSLPTTHFVDDYIFYTSQQKLCYGLYLALSELRVGDEVRIYIPEFLSYTTTMNENSGYAGPAGSTYVGYPVYFDVKIASIDEDPREIEVQRINDWVADNWGMTEADTLREGLYMRIIDARPLGDTITEDSTATYQYFSTFLDGHPSQTNIQSIAEEWGTYSTSDSYSLVSITNSTFTDTLSTFGVFPRVILNMRQGETAEAVAASWYAAGIYGDADQVPQVLPYDTQVYQIEVVDPNEDEETE